ncbi:MAG: PEP-CTERM sorting domain-containing protein, partial [Candidatus Methylumidiphilus sp.]
AAGAGRINLDATYDQYVDVAHGGEAGTLDVLGKDCHASVICNMGTVHNVGWDAGWSNQGGNNLYFIDRYLGLGSLFTATLDWYADINPGANANFAGYGYNHLADLNLTIFEYDPLTHAIVKTVAESISRYNDVEHLTFLLPKNGYYGLGVVNFGDLWNFNGATGETYGLAWSVDALNIPEPSSLYLMLAGCGGFFMTKRGGWESAKLKA